MSAQHSRIASFDIQVSNSRGARLEEVFRLGVLRDGIQLMSREIRFPILGQVIPRIELEISGQYSLKKVTVRVNQDSPFMFDGERVMASLNREIVHVPCRQFVDNDRAPTGMYNFGITRENGVRSFVFDYHVHCAYSCDFCFKENEWEVLAIEGGGSNNYKANFVHCLEYIHKHEADFRTKYDIVWLCTGSIKDEQTELARHCEIASKLRAIGYTGGIYVSQVVPPRIRENRSARIEYLRHLKRSGITRFNSGVEIVHPEVRHKYIHGFKGTYNFDDYVRIFEDAVSVFGRFGVGSCLLAGIEPAASTLGGLERIAALGVVPAPTVLTPFVIKQMKIPFVLNLDELIELHLDFHAVISKNQLPVFSGVFSLA
jgi:hypothetical protein